MHDVLLVAAVFLACVVETVETLTIVLALGVTRGWRSTMQGVAVGVFILAVIIVVLGPALKLIPLTTLRLVVGGLMLIYGLTWLRKAILRASGFKALHDEAEIYDRELIEAKAAARTSHFAVHDWYAFVVALKGVVLEGLEVVFIVITVGSNQGSYTLAVIGALIAVVFVSVAGWFIRTPLTRVPENSLKLFVGVLLTSFGTFWSAEGAGLDWPGGDAALVGVIAFMSLSTFVLIEMMRKTRSRMIA